VIVGPGRHPSVQTVQHPASKEEKVTQADEEARRRAERARQVALFRYQLIQEVIDPQLSARQRGQRVRELAAGEHQGPSGGGKVRVSEQTIRRWVRWWRAGGFEALVPAPARVSPRTPAEVLAPAVALKRENPGRTATQITRILRAQAGWAPSDRTVQRHFVRLELGRELAAKPQVFGRFEADRCNELWTGDALHGPVICGRKTYLFAFLDDRSRAVMAARFGFSEDTMRLAAALRPALASRGVPERIYVDNGSAFVDSWLLRACASLGIKLAHSAPGRLPKAGESRKGSTGI
jgi:putative transposase